MDKTASTSVPSGVVSRLGILEVLLVDLDWEF